MSFIPQTPHPDVTPDIAASILARAERACGIKVDSAKTDFLRLRAGARLEALGLSDFESYDRYLQEDTSGTELRNLVETLTTHTTSFFREKRHYDWLENGGFDELLQTQPSGSLTVWSAAASLGVELYSVGILLQERCLKGLTPISSRLIGTDISSRILQRARSATFTEDEITGLSPERTRRFVLRSRRLLDQNRKPLYRLVPEIRTNVRFIQTNLTSLSGLESFTADLIFLRNVLIYFTPANQERVVGNVLSRLRRGGILLTGHAEPLSGITRLEQISPTIYRKT